MAQAKKELTELQKNFLDALFSDEAKGNLTRAKEIAGYSPNTRAAQVVEELYEEIIELTKKYLAMNAPKAHFAMEDILFNPAQKAAMTKLKAATEILNRAGVKEKDGGDIKLQIPASGIVILPPKKIIEMDDDNTE